MMKQRQRPAFVSDRVVFPRALTCDCQSIFADDPTVRYHRIPMADSLSQHLLSFIDSALAFIAQVRLPRRFLCVSHVRAERVA
jgi:hypothetical protein